ncbi:MAG: cytochrome c oxidase subunit [Pseudomonadota bacterium]
MRSLLQNVAGLGRRIPKALQAVTLLALGLLAAAPAWATHPRDTLAPMGDGAEVSAWFFWLYLALDVVIFIVVAAGFFYAIMKFRKKPGDDDVPNLELHGNAKLELIWTIIPTIIILALSTVTVAGVFELSADPKLEQKLIDVDVIGKQWWWEYDYKQHGFSTATELHVEEETQVRLNLTSADVIHAFWVPRISGKRDATPGRVYPLSFKPHKLDDGKVAEYVGQCAELCGASHARMGIKLFVHPKEGPESFDNWVKAQQEKAREPQTELEQQGKKVFSTKGCVACHSVRGVAELTQRSRSTGPDLTHVGSRTSIVANTLPNSVENLARWVKNPQEVKEAALMTNLNLTDEESTAVATYLFSLK